MYSIFYVFVQLFDQSRYFYVIAVAGIEFVYITVKYAVAGEQLFSRRAEFAMLDHKYKTRLRQSGQQRAEI